MRWDAWKPLAPCLFFFFQKAVFLINGPSFCRGLITTSLRIQKDCDHCSKASLAYAVSKRGVRGFGITSFGGCNRLSLRFIDEPPEIEAQDAKKPWDARSQRPNLASRWGLSVVANTDNEGQNHFFGHSLWAVLNIKVTRGCMKNNVLLHKIFNSSFPSKSHLGSSLLMEACLKRNVWRQFKGKI